MDIQDIMFDLSAPMELKTALLELMRDEHISGGYTRVLVPTESNNDVNGSQHAGDNIDFTYRDATEADLDSVSTLGYYEYFSSYYGQYTGHYYNGEGRHFEAVVLNPPAYAATHTV